MKTLFNKMLAAFATVMLVQTGALSRGLFSTKSNEGNNLQALCAGEPINLKTRTDLNKLNEKLKQDNECSPMISKALVDLKSIADLDCNNVCTPEMTLAIEKFYKDYMEKDPNGNKKPALHKSLRRFAIAFGQQVSNTCRYNAQRWLAKIENELLSSEFLEVDEWVGNANELTGSKWFDATILPYDMLAIFRQRDERSPPSTKVYVQTKSDSMIANLQLVCERRFKPVYEEVLLPIVRLSKIGFNFDRTQRYPDSVGSNSRWSQVVFLCESLSRVEVVPRLEQGDDSVEADSSALRVLSEEEAAAVKNELGPFKQEEMQQLENIASRYINTKTASFCEDYIFEWFPGLWKSIDSFKPKPDELKRVKEQLKTRAMGAISNMLFEGKLHIGLGNSFKYLGSKLGLCHKGPETQNKRMLRALEKLTNNKSTSLTTLTTSTSVSAVSTMTAGTVAFSPLITIVVILWGIGTAFEQITGLKL